MITSTWPAAACFPVQEGTVGRGSALLSANLLNFVKSACNTTRSLLLQSRVDNQRADDAGVRVVNEHETAAVRSNHTALPALRTDC
jgi:hypothetical protein